MTPPARPEPVLSDVDVTYQGGGLVAKGIVTYKLG
jgi:hypothetical protein